MDGDEIELKLALPPDALNRLRRLPVLRRHRQGRPTLKTLDAVYYDTPDLALAGAGITVRVRHDGKGKTRQTVKTAGSRTSGLFSRREWEAEIAGPRPDIERLRATGLDILTDGSVCERLEPVFATHVRRSLHLLRGEDWRLELAIDVGKVRAGERSEPVCEVELELLEGSPATLFALAREIAARVPVRLLAQSKSDRGHALAQGRACGAVKATPLVLGDAPTLADAFRAIARNCLHHLLSNQLALVDQGDGEAVHQMRVALRRLRSALKIFRPLVAGPQLAPLREEIGWLLGQLGPARDAEVFLTEIIAPVADSHADHDGLNTLRAYWQAECRTDLAAAREAAGTPRFTRLLLDLGAWVEAGDWCTDPALPGFALGGEPLAPFARRVLKRLARRLAKQGGKRLSRLAPAELHRTRILGKQMRYAGEFFAPLYRKSAVKDTLALLGRLQDALGELNDIAVAAPRLAACHHLGETAWAAGMVAGWHEARRPRLIARADELWADLRRRKKFWKD